MKPTSLKEIALQIGAATTSLSFARGVAVDSRLVCGGDLFFALPGAQVDGHFFLADAASKGAVGAVVQTDYKGADYGMPLLRCHDVLQSLQELAKAYLKKSCTKVVAVTGSVGKTTTKDLIGHLLRVKYKVAVSPGNSNSQIGLPLTILNHTEAADEILVLEMGMTHPGQISKLIEIAPPMVAVVTTVALVHACNFDSLAGIAQAKAEIFTHPDTEVGFYPLECDVAGVLSRSGKCRKVSFSTESEGADFFLRGDDFKTEITYASTAENTSSVIMPPLSIPGEHNKHNFLAASAVARHFGISWDEIGRVQASFSLPERRLEMVEKLGAIFVNDAYNASEVSVKAAMACLPQPRAGGKRIAVLGEMLELGKFSEGCHRAVAEHALEHVDLMFCFGEECWHIFECWRAAGRPVTWAKERECIVAALRDKLQPGDVVLLKGSRGKNVWKVLEEL